MRAHFAASHLAASQFQPGSNLGGRSRDGATRTCGRVRLLSCSRQFSPLAAGLSTWLLLRVLVLVLALVQFLVLRNTAARMRSATERRCSEDRCGRSGCVRAQMGRMAEHVHPARVRPSSSSSGPARARKAPRNAECALGGPLSLSLSFACGQSRGARCGLVAALPVLRVRVHALGRPRRPPLDPASRACLCAPLGQRAVFEGRMRGEPAVGSSQAALPCF